MLPDQRLPFGALHPANERPVMRLVLSSARGSCCPAKYRIERNGYVFAYTFSSVGSTPSTVSARTRSSTKLIET